MASRDYSNIAARGYCGRAWHTVRRLWGYNVREGPLDHDVTMKQLSNRTNRPLTDLCWPAACVAVVLCFSGCGDKPARTTVAKAKPAKTSTSGGHSRKKSPQTKTPRRKKPRTNYEKPVQSPNLGVLAGQADWEKVRPYRAMPKRETTAAVASRVGLRKLSGQHLTLYTDVASSADVDILPKVFDAAFEQWCAYFRIDPKKVSDWHMTGFLMKDKQKFAASGLLTPDLPQFPNGYSRGVELWVYEQKTAYYRRHLLLHEGTHGFMNSMFGGCGGSWYMEGMAELMGTHIWDGQRLTMRHMPKTRDELAGWARVKFIRDGLAAGGDKVFLLPQLMRYSNRVHRDDAYGWSWALCALMDNNPRYQKAFRGLFLFPEEGTFSDRFREQCGDHWRELHEEFGLMALNLEYGYDVARMAIDYREGKPLGPAVGETVIMADRGWQSSGIQLTAGTTYRISASGRFQIAKTTKPWISEPGGVSVRYYKGRPLGQLLAAVRPLDTQQTLYWFHEPTSIGLQGSIRPKQTGTLYLRLNDSAAELEDNQGEVAVAVRAAD